MDTALDGQPAHRSRILERLAEAGVGLRFSTWAEADDVLGQDPDVAFVAIGGLDHGDAWHERRVDRVVVEHGTLPVADLHEEPKPRSVDLGEVDHRATLAGRPLEVVRNADGGFRLFRVGDAVAGRNIHAAIFDPLRLAKDI